MVIDDDDDDDDSKKKKKKNDNDNNNNDNNKDNDTFCPLAPFCYIFSRKTSKIAILSHARGCAGPDLSGA